MREVLEECSSSCGFVAAFISCLCFGSFCVPMKSEAARKLDVDPLVFQTYKTFMCFISSFVVLLLGVEKLTFTPWGIVSGLFWVPGGVAHVCGVRTAGLAISQGTSSSIIVLVAFSWGIFVFEERVKSVAGACFAVCMMIVGIVGMSYFSSHDDESNLEKKVDFKRKSPEFKISIPAAVSRAMDAVSSWTAQSACSDEAAELTTDSFDSTHDLELCKGAKAKQIVRQLSSRALSVVSSGDDKDDATDADADSSPAALQPSRSHEIDPSKRLRLQKGNGTYAIVSAAAYYLRKHCNIHISIRQMGLVFSAAGAVWGGSILVPLHFAGRTTKGLSYVFSFAVGATLVNLALWALRYNYLLKQHKHSHLAAYHSLPAFHFKAMALPGALSGLLWSVGNICSILSVTYLGEGVGYSMTQSAMLVSGLWGIFWFKEITSLHSIRGWMASASLAIAGILLLSYNHMPPLPKVVLKH